MRTIEGLNRLKVGCIDDLKDSDLEEIDFIVNLSDTCSRELAISENYCHFFILDSERTEDISYSNFKSIVKLLLQRLKDNPEETILVNCSMGISRSVTVAATVVAYKTCITFDSALEKTRSPKIGPSPALKEYGKKMHRELKQGETF